MIVVMIVVMFFVMVVVMFFVMVVVAIVVAMGIVAHDDRPAVAHVAACSKCRDRGEKQHDAQHEAKGSRHASPISIEGREDTGVKDRRMDEPAKLREACVHERSGASLPTLHLRNLIAR